MSHQNSFVSFRGMLEFGNLFQSGEIINCCGLTPGSNQTPSAACPPPPHPSGWWGRSGKKSKTRGLRWKRYNWNKVKYNKNSNKMRDKNLRRTSNSHCNCSALTDWCQTCPQTAISPSSGWLPESCVKWASCSVIQNVPLASRSHLYWPCFLQFLCFSLPEHGKWWGLWLMGSINYQQPKYQCAISIILILNRKYKMVSTTEKKILHPKPGHWGRLEL